MENPEHPFASQYLIPNIGKSSKFVNLLVKSHLREHKIPLSKEQFVVLLFIEKQPKPQSFLAMITERNKGSLTRLVQSLEKKAYLKRKVCSEDSRVNQVEITESGRVVLNRTKPIVSGLFKLLQNGVNPKEKEVALGVIQQIQENAVRELEKLEQSKLNK